MDDADIACMEQIEASAWRSLCAACPPALAARLGLALVDLDGGLLASCTALDQLPFNRLFGIDGRNIFAVDAVASAARRFRDAGLRNGGVQLPPFANAHRLETAARKTGLVPSPRAWAKFRIDGGISDVRADAPAVIEVDARRGDEFGATVAAGFGMPEAVGAWLACLPGRAGWHCYLALDDSGRPIGAGTLHCDAAGAWLGLGAVLAHARRRGAQSALLARRVRDAKAAGAALVTTETGVPLAGEPAPSHANLLRCGFRVVYRRANWILDG